jgi:hypothetical protein
MTTYTSRHWAIETIVSLQVASYTEWGVSLCAAALSRVTW